MLTCSKCGNQLPDEARFCPICGTAVSDEATVTPSGLGAETAHRSENTGYSSAPAGGWYQSAPQGEPVPPVTPIVPDKPSIGSVFDFYRKALAVLAKKPVRLWGLSLLYVFIAAIISGLGSLVPIISLPIVLLLSLGFTGVLLDGYHGLNVRSEQLFQGFKKDRVVRNGAGMCWMELWTLIWSLVPVMNIIKAYSYSFTPYILLTDSEITPTEALRKSMRMTDGYKGKMFWADILIGLIIGVAVIVLALLTRIPYIGFIFGIALFVGYLAVCLFLPIFSGLLRTAFFEEISAVHKD